MKVLGNPLSNLLILFLEKGVRSKNHCPDEEGIKTKLLFYDFDRIAGKNHCPDEEGIKTVKIT